MPLVLKQLYVILGESLIIFTILLKKYFNFLNFEQIRLDCSTQLYKSTCATMIIIIVTFANQIFLSLIWLQVVKYDQSLQSLKKKEFVKN